MNRFENLKKIIQGQNCFKMICGAGNEDTKQVKKLAFVYTLINITMYYSDHSNYYRSLLSFVFSLSSS